VTTNSSTRQKGAGISGCLLLSAGILFLGFRVDRMEFWEVLLGFIAAFSGYLLLVRGQFPSLKTLLLFGLALRVLLAFAFPLLSDDIYRFIWDGHLINSGNNPFEHLPGYYLRAGRTVAGLTPALYEQLNSPDFHTIYPPVAQGIFTLATWVSPDSWWGAAAVMKLFLIVAELGTALLLWSLLPIWNVSRNNLLFYWLNPLIIIEICGNLHFEGMMVFFLLLAFWCFFKAGVLPERFRPQSSSVYKKEQNKSPTRFLVFAALAFALSVASKLLTLVFLPFLIVRLWRRGNSRPFWIFSVAFGVFTLLLFLPLLSGGFLSGFGSSLDLYFRNFEFNASLYYLAREYGYYETGWNQIARFGPLLAQLAMVSILLFALAEGLLMNKTIVKLREQWGIFHAKISITTYPVRIPDPEESPTFTLPTTLLFAFAIYLICATTVHPWYLSLPIVLCCFGNWRFPLVWSFFIVLTYTSYTTEPYLENLWLVAVEYIAVLLFFVLEWRNGILKAPQPNTYQQSART
jgi:hypothetical protein